MSTPAVHVRDLHKHYGDKHAVDGLALDVDRGEIVAVLGPNGAGKTTTVEILEGFRHRDSGLVEVLGVDPAHGDRAWRSRIGIVLQQTNDLAELTVREQLHHFARYYPNARDPEQVLEAVGLVEKAGTRSRQLSGGQRRRLDVALGILGTPDLLFLDEPTTGFDPQARRDFWDLVLALREEGTTILLTTHYLEEAEYLADRVVVVNDGHVIESGAPAALGGREARRPTVHWLQDGVARTVRTATPTAVVAELTARLAGPDGEVPGLAVVRPSLEDVYLDLIGHTALDAPAPSAAPSTPSNDTTTTTTTTTTTEALR